MSEQNYPKGWDAARVQRLIIHYESSSEDELLAEDEAARERDGGIPPAIVILPMDTQEETLRGWSSERVQNEFFLDRLPKRGDCGYIYGQRGLKEEPGKVVLFQHRGNLIASAVLDYVKRSERKLCFDRNSIMVFDPVSPEIVAGVWPKFKQFGNARQSRSLTPSNYPKFVAKLTRIRRPAVQVTQEVKA